MNKEIINAIKSTKSVDELKEVASKNGYKLTDKDAKGYFDMYHTNGKLGENELDNVSGGACTQFCNFKAYGGDNDLLIVSGLNTCDGFTGYVLDDYDKQCQHCDHSKIISNPHTDTRYCTKRTYYDDPYNSLIGTTRTKLPNGKYW